MPGQNPIPYYGPSPSSNDLSHLKTLSICHYVLGGLAMLFSSIFIVHVVLGIWLANGGPTNATWSTPTNSATVNVSSFGPQQKPPAIAGYAIAAMGGCAVLFGWAFGILTIVSGRRIAQHRSRIFSMVVAGINCIWFPLGTLLGIFTIIVLARDSVSKLYDADALRPPI
jgi:hypothetical protein